MTTVLPEDFIEQWKETKTQHQPEIVAAAISAKNQMRVEQNDFQMSNDKPTPAPSALM